MTDGLFAVAGYNADRRGIWVNITRDQRRQGLDWQPSATVWGLSVSLHSCLNHRSVWSLLETTCGQIIFRHLAKLLVMCKTLYRIASWRSFNVSLLIHRSVFHGRNLHYFICWFWCIRYRWKKKRLNRRGRLTKPREGSKNWWRVCITLMVSMVHRYDKRFTIKPFSSVNFCCVFNVSSDHWSVFTYFVPTNWNVLSLDRLLILLVASENPVYAYHANAIHLLTVTPQIQ